MQQRVKRIQIGVLILVVVYIVGLFVHVPIALAGPQWLSGAASGVYRYLYRPVINSLADDNFLKIQWQNYSAYWCEKYPDRCGG